MWSSRSGDSDSNKDVSIGGLATNSSTSCGVADMVWVLFTVSSWTASRHVHDKKDIVAEHVSNVGDLLAAGRSVCRRGIRQSVILHCRLFYI